MVLKNMEREGDAGKDPWSRNLPDCRSRVESNLQCQVRVSCCIPVVKLRGRELKWKI